MTNSEAEAVQVALVSGALWNSPFKAELSAADNIIRNLSTTRYDAEIAPGETKDLPYSFVLDMQPVDNVQLFLMALVSTPEGELFQVAAFNGTASVVEAPVSFFDPQM